MDRGSFGNALIGTKNEFSLPDFSETEEIGEAFFAATIF